MIKNKFLLLLLLISGSLFAQENKPTEPLYINVFINLEKEIYVETEKIPFSGVGTATSEIIRKAPFRPDQRVVYRIFADENLKLGYVRDVNQEMINAFNEDVASQYFLLNTTELNIDGNNWFDKINFKEDLQKKL